MRRVAALALLVAGVLAAGCASNAPIPEVGTLYNRAAQHHGPERNPVIVIPGILGSRLVDDATGTVVWGAFAGKYANPQTPEGARLTALPMQRGADLADLTDRVRVDGALETFDFALLGLPIELKAYSRVLRALGAGGFRDSTLDYDSMGVEVDWGKEHFTCFQFAYDWRRDNVENSRRLAAFIEQKRQYVAAEYNRRGDDYDKPIKFDIVAHSMGGLVARYYLRYGDADLPADGTAPTPTWAGAANVDKLILVGTPSAGALDAIVNLAADRKFAPLTPTYPTAIMGSMPALYQLMPRDRHGQVVDEAGKPLKLMDPATWQRLGWGLASPGIDESLRVLMPDVTDPAERRAIALDHQAKCLQRAERFFAALDAPASPPAGTTIHLFAGDARPTRARIVVDTETGSFKTAGMAPGDGTVLRSSALMDERVGGAWSPRLRTPIAFHSVTFCFTDHLGLTFDPTFTDNVLHLLLESPR